MSIVDKKYTELSYKLIEASNDFDKDIWQLIKKNTMKPKHWGILLV